MIIDNKACEEATTRLNKYLEQKKEIDQRITSNEEFWKLRHWSQLTTNNAAIQNDEKPVSAWLFNSLANKHADIMDNYPKPNILPREADDEDNAKMLSDIVPLILERNDYEEVYSDKHWYKLKNGTCVTGVFWDNNKQDGKGDITIEKIDLHNLAWEMGVDNIQNSREVFLLSLEDNEILAKAYPELEGHLGQNNINRVEYIKDYTDEADKYSCVVDWYYKVKIPQVMYDDGETQLTAEKTIVHYAKFCNGILLYASENIDEMQEEGYYEHGQYPFVFDTLFPIEESVVGFGYIDVMKEPQKYIDKLDQMINKNAYLVGNPRYWISKGSGINVDDFADWSNQLVEVAGNLDNAIRPMDIPTIPTSIMTQKESKIEELKETSGNRDFSQGSTAAGVTAASAIAALQEAGSKLSRDMIKGSYRAFCEEVKLVIELVRQFYTEPRNFRVDNVEAGNYDFVKFDNSNINREEIDEEGNVENKRPIFDIKISAEKKSPFSRAAQNEMAKEMYGMGWFAPQNAEPALIALEMMEFEGKEKIKQQIQQQSTMFQQFQQMQAVISQADAMYPQLQLGAQAGIAEPAPMPMTPNQAPKKEKDGSMAAKMRERARTAAEPGKDK